MHRLWSHIIEPILRITEPRVIVEVGCEDGKLSRRLLEYCEQSGSTLHVIDPLPLLNAEEWASRHPDRFILHKNISLETLPLLPDFDAILLDGDHNWYTVLHELRLIDAMATRSGRSPWIFLHDTGWPYGERDLYYAPHRIPPDDRQQYAKGGLAPDRTDVRPEEGINAHLFHAIHSGGERNGVRAGIGQFLHETNEDMHFMTIPCFHGLGVLARRTAWDTHPGVAAFLQRFQQDTHVDALLRAMEQERIRQEAEADRQRTIAMRLRRAEELRHRTLERFKKKMTQLNQQVMRMERSKSWRLTDPLRRMERMVRGNTTSAARAAFPSPADLSATPGAATMMPSARVADDLLPPCTPLPYVITGTGRSGTTFLAHVFHAAGFDLGNSVDPVQIGQGTRPPGGGMEDAAFIRMNTIMLDQLRLHVSPQEIARGMQTELSRQRYPAVIKSPLYAVTFRVWKAAGYSAKHVFICVRNPEETRQSFVNGFGNAGSMHINVQAAYALITDCIEHDVPHTIIAYPRIGRDRAYAERTLGAFIPDAWSVIQRTWDPGLLHCTNHA